ncbi:Gfo/Idh/MocA family protein [Jannaschia formosa]|uniref:Gfo/Idh/MocA family protein n=1 Tax=Jannaschia formosa TaxID=2259592 RepID=UPI000E1BC74B|nr:Gfo/Idh/MocA family oxidoreductase [Jannaschia formosa]TFL16314.1 Gfo/Idh/MocA family oxidoreductase [Jannaschia formosa]
MTGIGILGAGNISESYLSRAPLFAGIEVRAVADLDPARAAARAETFGVRAETVEGLLAAPDIDIVVNLTVPTAHHAVTCAILEAGKHAYSEKPLALTLADARDIAARADRAGRRVGCAPDTFLGASHQESRRLIDAGAVGRIVHGTCHVMSAGMEGWHPNPDFFFQAGGGPILDLGAYYVTQLINLIGPVTRVAAMTGTGAATRTIGSGARAGETITVEIPTTAHALLEFASGATVTLGASWDVQAHGHRNVELYGTEGTIAPQDPNFFGGTTEVIRPGGAVERFDAADHPLSVANRTTNDGAPRADYRTVGLADMAEAIRGGRPHRCALEMALHVTEVLEGILTSGEQGRFVTMATTCDRPAALDAEAARALMRADPVPA